MNGFLVFQLFVLASNAHQRYSSRSFLRRPTIVSASRSRALAADGPTCTRFDSAPCVATGDRRTTYRTTTYIIVCLRQTSTSTSTLAVLEVVELSRLLARCYTEVLVFLAASSFL